jgi:site-specific DNA recombinase
MNAAAYIRVSTDRQRDNYSPETQREAIKKHCQAKGYTLTEAHFFADVYTAKGSADHRPGLEALKIAVISGGAKVVVALKADRLFRDQLEAAAFLKFLRQYKCKLDFVLEGEQDDSPLGTFLYSARMFGAEMHWEAIKEATGRAMQARIDSGKPLPGTKPLYGYRWADDDKSRLQVYEPEASVVRMIFEELARGGSSHSLAERLHADPNIPSPSAEIARKQFERGKRDNPHTAWASTTIRCIARNEAYTGKAYAKKWEVWKDKETGKRHTRLKPVEERTLLPDGIIPRIVDEALFRAAGETLQRNRISEGPRRSSNPQAHLLRSGYARCGQCGAALAAINPKEDRHNRQPFYQCGYGTRKARKGNCQALYITAAELDAAAWAMVRQVIDEPEWAKDLIRAQSDTAVIEADLASYDAHITELERKRSNYVKRLAIVDDDTAALISAELRKLNPELEAAKHRRASMEARRDNLSRIDSFLDRLSNHMASVDNLTYEEKRVIIDKLGVTARVWPKAAPQRYAVEMAYDLDALALQAIEQEPFMPEPRPEDANVENWMLLPRLAQFADKTAIRSSRLHMSAIP